MSSIHKLSSITPLSEFDIFGVPPTQATVTHDILTEHRPMAPIDSKSHIEFKVSSGIDEYIRLDKSWLYIRIQVTIAKPLKVLVTKDDWKQVSTVNNLLNSLFKQVDLIIGTTPVTLARQTYPYKTDFEIKLGKSKEAKDSFLTSGLWYEDDAEGAANISARRGGFIASQEDSSQGNVLDLMGKIHLPMFEQRRSLLGGCSFTLKLIPNDPTFYMMCSNSVRVTNVDFSDATLFLHRSKISRPVLDGHIKGLEIANARYPLRESYIVPITISANKMDEIVDNVHNGQLPKRAFVALVSHSAYNGSYTLNPYFYDHFDLSYLAFYLNGIQYPEKAFTPDYDNNLYVREYLSLFEATNQDNAHSCINMDRTKFANGNNIFAVNFSPDLSSGCCATGYVNPINHGSLRLHLKFRKPLPKTITVLVYLEFDTILEINNERNPIYEFN